MTLVPKDLKLPRTVTLDLKRMTTEALEIGSRGTHDRRTYEVSVYSTMRGDMGDMLEIVYNDLHKGGNLNLYPDGPTVPVQVGKVSYENFRVTYFKPFYHEGKTIHSASIEFDAVSKRSG
jgi:hypothetical protein